MERDNDAEIKSLFAKLMDEQKRVDKDNSFHFVRGKRRDIMIHVAVTVTPDVCGRTVVGEKENEICQFAVRIDADKLPIRLAFNKAILENLTLHAHKRMLAAGLVTE